MPEPAALQPSSALAAYAESLVEGRRVLVIGNALSALPAQLLERGARWVYVCDLDPARVGAAASSNRAREVTFAALSDGSLALREGAFDVALVENLGAVGDVVGVLKHVQRALTPKGVALVASPNPEARRHLLGEHDPSGVALDYYSLYDAVAAQFRQVRMLAQTPFVGYAIVDFAPDGEPQPTIDAGFVPGGSEEPEWFVALGSQQPSELDFFTLVQVRFADAFRAASRREPSVAKAETRAPREARVETGELQLLQKELARRDAWIAELENRALAADTRADQTQSELDELQEKLAAKQDAAEKELNQARATQAAELKATLQQRDSAQAAELKAALQQRDTLQAAELKAALQQRDTLNEELGKLRSERQAEQATSRSKLASLEARLTEQSRELEALRNEARAQTQALGEAKQEAGTLRATVRGQQEALSAAQEAPPELKAELGSLEQQLAERGTHIRRLEHELRSAEQTGRELILALREYQTDAELDAPSEDAEPRTLKGLGAIDSRDLRPKLDALADAHALQKADLAAAEWRVQYLETRLEQLPQAAEEASERLARLERELTDARAVLAGHAAR